MLEPVAQLPHQLSLHIVLLCLPIVEYLERSLLNDLASSTCKHDVLLLTLVTSLGLGKLLIILLSFLFSAYEAETFVLLIVEVYRNINHNYKLTVFPDLFHHRDALS
jgi:hypothetical protein